MPINIPDGLPAFQVLENERIFVMAQGRAQSQDIRPLRLVIMNLMPTKIATETQLLRMLSNTPLQVDVVLLQSESHDCRNTEQAHLNAFYQTFSEIKDQYFDGMIITGAPVETLPFEEIDYWDELVEIMDWSVKHVFSTWHICWGAMAGLYYHYGIPKYDLPEKMFGVFPHHLVVEHCPLFRGYDDVFYAPHSRHTEIRVEDIEKVPELMLEAVSDEAGVYLVSAKRGRQFFVTGHSEYDVDTLKQEYDRDSALGRAIQVPAHYYPNDDPTQAPMVSWRCHGNLMYQNWLNYYVYQGTPFDLDHEPDFSLYE